MLKKKETHALLLFLCITSIWFWKFCFVSPLDCKKYQQSDAKIRAIAHHHTPSGEQKRQGVTKDLWLTQDSGDRLHSRIESRDSKLILLAKKEHVELIEELKKVRITMQEKLTASGQQIRYFDADEGHYTHSLKQFVAGHAALKLYRLPGQKLPSSLEGYSPVISGTSEKIFFSLLQKGPKFDAHNFKAQLGKS